MSGFPTWRPIAGSHSYGSSTYEREVLATEEEHAAGVCTATIESFGFGWYANALPPQGDGTSSMVPGMIRGGNFGDRVEDARAWCERICGCHPEHADDRRTETA